VLGAAVVEAVTDTCVSDVTLDGANATVALESELEIVPPVAGVITAGGGDRPLAVFAFGSGALGSALVGLAVLSCEGADVVAAPTSTVTVPVPEPAAAPGCAEVPAGSEVPDDAAVPVLLVDV
jgi:hypothetical protein